MTQEDRQILLVDISARLPYGVKVAIEYSKGKYTDVYDLKEIDNDATSELRQRVTVWNYGFYSSVISYPLINCRPYLRPISSITKEERHEIQGILGKDVEIIDYINIIDSSRKRFSFLELQAIFDWLNAHHFDYRGLIEKGLALKAPEDMYKR